MRRTDLGMPSSEADNESLQPKHLSFTPEAARPAATTGNRAEKSPLDFQRQEIEENVQILKVQVASAKDELEKLNCESRHFQSLSEIRGQLCNNCHCCGHTKVKCSKAPCTDINACKIKEKHPEYKAKIGQLQREIRSLENKLAHLKGFTAARESAKSSFFYVFERMNYYSRHSMTFFIFGVAFFIFPFHFYKSNSCRMQTKRSVNLFE